MPLKDKFRQYKSRFSLILEQMLAFALTTNLVREVMSLPLNFKQVA